MDSQKGVGRKMEDWRVLLQDRENFADESDWKLDHSASSMIEKERAEVWLLKKTNIKNVDQKLHN